MDVNYKAIFHQEKPRRIKREGGKRQFGNQGGRTITTRLNHKEVIFLFCLGAGQEREVFAAVRVEELGYRTQCINVYMQAISHGY